MKNLINKARGNKKKVAVVILFFVIIFILWAELAVGVFNSPIAGS